MRLAISLCLALYACGGATDSSHAQAAVEAKEAECRDGVDRPTRRACLRELHELRERQADALRVEGAERREAQAIANGGGGTLHMLVETKSTPVTCTNIDVGDQVVRSCERSAP